MVALEEAILPEIRALPHPVRTLYDAGCCPEDALPHLAWAFSVDYWNDAWSEAVKRRVIGESLPVHRVKGSVGAVRRALAGLGIDAQIEEWFAYGGPVHTFRIDAVANTVFDAGFRVDAGFVAEVGRVVDAAKPLRSHYALRVGERMTTRAHVRSGIRAKVRQTGTLRPEPRTQHAGRSLSMRAGQRSVLRSTITHDVIRRTV